MNAITLPPDLERFADDIVAQGRFRDVAEVVRAGMTLLQHAEAERATFVASLEEARAEGKRDGLPTIEEVEAPSGLPSPPRRHRRHRWSEHEAVRAARAT